MESISNTIRKIMIDRNMTVTQLADILQTPQPSVSRKINNSTADYRIGALINILDALDCCLNIDIIDKQTHETVYSISNINDKQ